jgi:hypothetical protein
MKYLHRLLLVLASASFFIACAHAQNGGTVTNHAIPIGKGPGVQGFTSLICGNTAIPIGQTSADPICAALSGDVTMSASGVTAIGASKVTNAQLATMGANTTKCNATAGTANPTDCNASTMRTNLGLVIGTNVEAWDADLDCLAALSSTGVLSRTGAGTCSAGALALSGLATGTQDTVIGYWGSTTATAIAINNCTGALTYSTSTHTFGCNSSAGTGTVTSVTCFGSAITTTGTCTVAATKSSQQTGSSATDVVTPSQQQQHDSAAKVVLMFTGSGSNGAQTINFNYNVNAATRTSTGVYSISLINAFSSSSYACVGASNGGTTDGAVEFITQTASSIVAVFKTFASGAGFDPVNGAYIVCYGRQ